MVWGQEWAGTEATNRSYELLARHVVPTFQGALVGLERSNAVARSKTEFLQRERIAGVERAQERYEESTSS